MSKEMPNDDPRQKTGRAPTSQTDEPWNGTFEKDQLDPMGKTRSREVERDEHLLRAGGCRGDMRRGLRLRFDLHWDALSSRRLRLLVVIP